MIIDLLRQEHRNIEKLLLVLEQELSLFARGERPDYEVIRAIIAYFEVYPDAYHHPQEDMVFKKLKARDPAAAASVGDLAAEHRSGAERLRRVAQAVQGVLEDREILRQTVDGIIRDFITRERQHMAMEERLFFPTAIMALQPEDWAEIDSTLTDQKDRFSVRSSKSDSTRCESISCSWKRRLRRSAADRVLTDRRAGSQC